MRIQVFLRAGEPIETPGESSFYVEDGMVHISYEGAVVSIPLDNVGLIRTWEEEDGNS